MDSIEACARQIYAARVTGTRMRDLEPASKPSTLADAYAVQDRVMRLLGEPVGGWKVGAISFAHPSTVAPIPASRLLATPATLPSDDSSLLGIEAEVAFKFKRDFEPSGQAYSKDEILDSIESVHPVIEVLESRFEDILSISRLTAVADNISNGHLIHGPSVSDWRSLNLERPFIKVTNKGRLFSLGIGNNGGDPFRLLCELVNHAASARGGLSRDALVTTGTCTGIIFCKPGDDLRVEFRGLGVIELKFEVRSPVLSA